MSRHALRILVLQHSPDSPPGVIGEAFDEAGASMEVVDCCTGPAVETWHAELDGLIALGGPQCAADDDEHPHFPALLDLIRAYHEHSRPVLGICLGAQLLARALGGCVHKANRPEFGFIPLERLVVDDPLLNGMDFPLHVMQWHDDSFEMPPGSVPLLTSATCSDQAFRAGRATYGFQGHIEVNRRIVTEWARWRARLDEDPTIPEMVDRQAGQYLEQAADAGRRIARRWLALA